MPQWAILGANDIRVIPPALKPESDRFIVQEGLWKWREIDYKASKFDALNASIRPPGYVLSQAAKGRVSQCVVKAILSFKSKVCSPLLGKNARIEMKSSKTYELEVYLSENAKK